MGKGIRILLADDHDIVREGLRSLLEKETDIEVVGEADNGHAAVELTAAIGPDVVLMDITMPDLNGVEATRRINALAGAAGEGRRAARVIALSMHCHRRFVAEMLKAGASGYLLKECTSQELIGAIRSVYAGHTYISPAVSGAVVDDYVRHVPSPEGTAFGSLTARQREVLQMVAEGKTTKEIAARLHVSLKTVEVHRSQIMQKLGIDSVAGLTKFAVVEGLTALEP